MNQKLTIKNHFVTDGIVTNGESTGSPEGQTGASKDYNNDIALMSSILEGTYEPEKDSITPPDSTEKAVDSPLIPEVGGGSTEATPNTATPTSGKEGLESKPKEGDSELLAKFNALTEKFNALNEQLITLTSKKEVVDQPKETPIIEDFQEVDFLGEEDPYDVIRDKSSINKLLNNLAKTNHEKVAKAINSVQEKIVPAIISQLKAVQEVSTLSDKFYSENADLVPHKAEVAKTFEAFTRVNPQSSLQDLLEMAEVTVRKKLGLQKVVTTSTSTPDFKPPTPPSRPSSQKPSTSSPTPSKIDVEIAEMTKALES